jgi:metal-responsive CopG/Arc/MetJ family transcriptional regulator
MKTAISIPDDLYRAAERAAKRLGLSRSEFYQRAVAQFLERQSDTLVTDALNEIYRSEESSALDPVLDRMQRASLSREDW